MDGSGGGNGREVQEEGDVCTHIADSHRWTAETEIVIVAVKQLSDQISRSVMSDSLQTHESQHARPPWPSPTPGVHWHSRPSSQWCHLAISSSVIPFSSCPQTEHWGNGVGDLPSKCLSRAPPAEVQPQLIQCSVFGTDRIPLRGLQIPL